MPSVHLIQLNPNTLRILKSRPQEARLYPTSGQDRFFVSDYSLHGIRLLKLPYRNLMTYHEEQISVEVAFPYQAYLFDLPNEEAINEVQAMGMAKFPERKKVQALYLGRFQTPDRNTFVLDRPGGKRAYHWTFSPRPKKVIELKNKFPKMIKRISDPQTKVLLSFGSGGIRLFAHSSLMKFIETLHLKSFVKEVWGSSG